MAMQLLVNVLNVGPLAPGASVTVPHGLLVNGESVAPTLIQPNGASPIRVTVVTDTTVTFENFYGVSPESALFRCERGLSNELDADAVTPSFWTGAPVGGGGGGVAGVTASAPIASSGGAVPNISLNDSGVAFGPYGDLAAANQTVVPVFTVDAKGRITTAASGAIKINGSDAKTYVDTQDTATLNAAKVYAEGLAFGISSKEPAHVATDIALPNNTKVGVTLVKVGNGAFPTVDGEPITINQRVLVKNETDAAKNGIYYLKVVGDGVTPWVLERTADANTASELCGSIIPVETGTQAGTVWIFAANSTTFVEWTTAVTWVELTVGAATTGTLGVVQLAGGLGGGTNAASPKLNVDAANVGGGTLPSNRGGTGFDTYTAGDLLQGNGGNLVKLLPGAAGTFLKSNGPATALSYGTISASDIPPIKLARTYYVSTTGNDLTGDGSINNPFITIDAAITQAGTDFPGGDAAQINVAPGSYAAFTLSRKNTFIQGAGARPEDRVTQILSTTGSAVTITPAGATLIFNEQVGIDGCFIQTTANAPAIDITVGPVCTVTITNSYVTTNNAGASAHALRCAAASKVVVQNAILTTQAASTSPVVSVSAGDIKIADTQVQNAGQTNSALAAFVDVTGVSSVFMDRVLAEQSYVYSSRGITLTGSKFGSFIYKLLVSNSSITVDGSAFYWTSITGNPLVWVTNTTIPGNDCVDPASTAAATFYYSNLFNVAPSIPIAPAAVPAYQVLGDTYVPNLNASSFIKTGGAKELTAVANIAASDFAAQTANTVLAGPTTAGPTAPTFRALVAADIPTLPASKITAIPYDVAGAFPGQPGAAAEVFWFKATRAFNLSSTGTNHKFTARTPSTSATPKFTLYKNTLIAGNAILEALFNVSATGAVTILNAGANNSLAIDDTIILVAPAVQDTTLADIFWTLSATLNP